MDKVDISELKQITASSEIKANADTNKMHYDSIVDLANGADEKEASLILKVFARRYPNLMFTALSVRMDNLNTYLNNTVDVLEDLRNGER